MNIDEFGSEGRILLMYSVGEQLTNRVEFLDFK
jgi:hypothetical protein